MKFLEAANKFKKIRLADWGKSAYVEIKDGTIIFNCIFMSYDLLSDDKWEEYKEPRKYLENNKEAMQALIDGKKITKECFDEGLFYKINEEGFIVDQDGDYVDPIWPTPNNYGKFYVVED